MLAELPLYLSTETITSINIPELKKDYKSMQVMIFGEKPPFDKILNTLQNLENEINSIFSKK